MDRASTHCREQYSRALQAARRGGKLRYVLVGFFQLWVAMALGLASLATADWKDPEINASPSGGGACVPLVTEPVAMPAPSPPVTHPKKDPPVRLIATEDRTVGMIEGDRGDAKHPALTNPDGVGLTSEQPLMVMGYAEAADSTAPDDAPRPEASPDGSNVSYAEAADSTPAGDAPRPKASPEVSTPEQIKTPEATDVWDARRVADLTTDIRAPAGERPQDIKEIGDIGAKKLLSARSDEKISSETARIWPDVCYFWEAPVLCNQPLYFEEVNLERYGYSPCHLPLVQPCLSGAQFFLNVGALPYKLVAEPPCRCIYTLGQYRPGSPVPYRCNWPEFKPLAGAVEAGIVACVLLSIP